MGVSMSTFFSCPSLFFFTLTLQAGRTSMALKARTKADTRIRAELPPRNLGMCMLRSFLCDLCRPLDAGAALSNVGNADWQVAVNGDFAKQSLDRTDLRDAGVGESAKIILYGGEILCHVGISHGEDSGFLRGMIQNRLQQRAAGVVQRNRVGQSVRALVSFMALPAVGTT